LNALTIISVLGTVTALFRALPQLVKLVRTQDVAGISVDGAATGTVVMSAWTTYGFLTDQPGVILACGIPAITFAAIALASLRYGRKLGEIKAAPLWLPAFATFLIAGGVTGLGIALSVGALIANTPHVLVAYREKDLSGISPTMWRATCTDGALWVAYGVISGDIPILVNNTLNLVTGLAIVIRHRRWRSSLQVQPLVSGDEALATA
jgi:uncharacterized protein with PQ loop repeat